MTEREVLTIADAMARAHVSRRTIYNWIEAGKVEVVRTPGGAPRIYGDTLLTVEPIARAPVAFTPPAGLGAFKFPAPYNTQGIRLTNATNAPQGCQPRLYPYWSPINNHRGQSFLYVVLGRIGAPPLLLTVDKASGSVRSAHDLPLEGTAEGWYFSDTLASSLYVLAGPRLQRYDVFDGRTTTVFTLNPQYGDDLSQAHSSADDTVHSATVRRRVADGAYPKLGCVVYRKGQQRFFGVGDHDECQVEKSGRWLIVQKDDNDYIFDLDADKVRVILNADGAVAHLDAGDGLIAGEDDQHEAGALVAWDLDNPQSQRRLLYATGGPSLGHSAIRAGRVLLSSDFTGDLIDIPLGGSDPFRLVAPGMMAVAPGMTEDEKYDRQLRGCPDPLGEYACFVSNMGDPYGRYDAFLVHVSAQQANPPTIIHPKPGGSMTYEAMGGDAAGQRIGTALFADYAEAGKPPDDGMAIWFWRTAFDALSMSVDASIRKHQREWRAELGLSGGSVNP